MKVIKILLEYSCFPVWVYDESGELLDNDLPDCVIGDVNIEVSFVRIQRVFDSLFTNDSVEFRYNGFESNEEKVSFQKEFDKALYELTSKTQGEYIIENEVSFSAL